MVMDQAVDDRAQAAIDGNLLESTLRCLSSDFHSNLNVAADAHYHQKICALNLVRDSVVALDPQGRVAYLNHAAEDLYGLRFTEIAGRPARTTLFNNAEEMFDNAWSGVHADGHWRGEYHHPGGERRAESRWSTVVDHKSQITSILVVGSELTHTKTVPPGFAHEIRNQLAGIKGVADAFLQRGRLTQQESEWMEAVRCEVMKIDAHMREVLDSSQPRVSNVKPCLLNDLISGVVQLARHHAKSISRRQSREISIDFIDATTKPLMMYLDAARIEDAVLNLVLNAIEAIEGNGCVTVSLRTVNRAGKGEALIEVVDNGNGIPVEIRRRIFDSRFTTKREGSGLGLAAVRRTADAYQGRITFKTKVGHGSKFVLALPLAVST